MHSKRASIIILLFCLVQVAILGSVQNQSEILQALESDEGLVKILEVLEQEVRKIRDRIVADTGEDRLEHALELLETVIRALQVTDARVSVLAKRSDSAVEESLSTLSQDFTELKNRVDGLAGLKSRVDELADLKSRIDDLAGLKNRVDDLAKSLAEVSLTQGQQAPQGSPGPTGPVGEASEPINTQDLDFAPGTLAFLSPLGNRALQLGNDAREGFLHLYNAEGVRTAELFSNRGSGFIRLANRSGQRSAELGAVSDGSAFLQLGGKSAPAAYLGGSRGGYGLLELAAASGRPLVSISAASYGGLATLRDTRGQDKIELGVDSSGNGSIRVNGEDVSDYAEFFPLARDVKWVSGTVVSVSPASPFVLRPSTRAYDNRVIGVLCCAGSLQPGLIIGNTDSQYGLPVAVVGQVYVRVSLEGGEIEPGDLLVSASVPGLAMRAQGEAPPAGTVIGKALEAYPGKAEDRSGIIRMLVLNR